MSDFIERRTHSSAVENLLKYYMVENQERFQKIEEQVYEG